MAWKGKIRKGTINDQIKEGVTYNGIEFQSLIRKEECINLLHEEANIPVEYEEHSFIVFDALVYPQACYEGTPKKLYNKG